MKKEKVKKIKNAGVHWGIMFCVILVVFMLGTRMMPTPVLEQDDEGDWHIVCRVIDSATAEANPGTGASGWLATFQLNYTGSTPSTALTDNASGGYDAWGNVSGYVDSDNNDTDLPSEAGNYYVVRCRFNDTVKSGGNFMDDRCRVKLTVSGDETISDVAGTRVVSQNSSSDTYIWINFYWDDAGDGYRITDDGSMAWNITVYAKY